MIAVVVLASVLKRIPKAFNSGVQLGTVGKAVVDGGRGALRITVEGAASGCGSYHITCTDGTCGQVLHVGTLYNIY